MQDLLETPEIKAIKPFIYHSKELENVNNVFSYYMKAYATQKAFNALKKFQQEGKNVQQLQATITQWFNELEAQKVSIQSLIQNKDQNKKEIFDFSMKLFLQSDNEERDGLANKQTATNFQVVARYIELLSYFGPLSQDLNEKKKYAKSKAIEITKLLKDPQKYEQYKQQKALEKQQEMQRQQQEMNQFQQQNQEQDNFQQQVSNQNQQFQFGMNNNNDINMNNNMNNDDNFVPISFNTPDGNSFNQQTNYFSQNNQLTNNFNNEQSQQQPQQQQNFNNNNNQMAGSLNNKNDTNQQELIHQYQQRTQQQKFQQIQHQLDEQISNSKKISAPNMNEMDKLKQMYNPQFTQKREQAKKFCESALQELEYNRFSQCQESINKAIKILQEVNSMQ